MTQAQQTRGGRALFESWRAFARFFIALDLPADKTRGKRHVDHQQYRPHHQ
ncbi:hypothetical protein HU762_21385 [Pseudomonas sp. SWRI92]|uniref:hypothetical protein n=1 Tax=Pseudomonas sp. SWRI92 TaxID=2745499 RepID=UPI001644620D|nr:hypothetical protein [Pseudomonas sp. SWRI92]MBC3376500.1 hypothetical protein [Pseudomonas sp. SWRI92]